MRIFIDGEWNSYGGELISFAAVAEDGREFYEVLGCTAPDPWVAEHVMPVLYKDPISYTQLQRALEAFLMQFPSVHVIADWPEDIAWLCTLLITGPGTRANTPKMTFEIERVCGAGSDVPHNALSDARGLKAFMLEQGL